MLVVCFFFNDTATTEIYTLSLHDALPILEQSRERRRRLPAGGRGQPVTAARTRTATSSGVPRASTTRTRSDRKSTRLNSSHANISYAVFCLKKKKKAHSSNTFTSATDTNC